MNSFVHISSITKGIQWRQAGTVSSVKCFLVQEILHTDLDEFGKGLVDKDEWDQERENFLSETRDKSDQEASLKCYHEHHDDDKPEPNPYTTRQVLQFVIFTELLGKKVDM